MLSALTDESRFQMAFRYLHYEAKRKGFSPRCHDVQVIAFTVAADNWDRLGTAEEFSRFMDGVITGEGDFTINRQMALAMATTLFSREVKRRHHNRFVSRNAAQLAQEIGVGVQPFRDFITEARLNYH
jgi:hypothetical protein